MNVVGHKDVGMDLATGLVGILAQPIQKGPVVLLGNKARLPIIAAMDDVQRDIRQGQARAARLVVDRDVSRK
jgi:hypothetical protein